MKKYLALLISFLFFFFWFSCLTSQSLMDLSDFLLLVTGATLLILKARSAKDWRMLWPRTTGLGWLWLVWIVIVAIGLFINNPVNRDTLSDLFEFRWMLSFQLLCFTLSWIEWDDRKAIAVMSILLLMSAVSFPLYIHHRALDARAGGPFFHSMPFAHTYGPAFVFISGLVVISLQNKTRWLWLSLITAFLCAVITSLSMTRGVWIGMFAGVVSISFFRSRRYGIAIAACLILLFALTLTFSQEARERTLSTATSDSDNLRKALWLGNFEIVKDYPIFGTGYSQNKYYLRPYYDKLGYPKDQFISHAHNQYLHMWAGTGTLGLICYLVFLATTLRYTIVALKRLAPQRTILKALTLGSLGGQICFIVDSLTEANFSIAKNRFMFLLISAVGVSIYYRYIAKSNFQEYKKIPPII